MEKIRTLIELKALRVDDKQHASHSTMLPLNHLDVRRTRKPTIRDARMTEQLERKQRFERERYANHKHVEQLSVICSHGRDVTRVNRVAPRQGSPFGLCSPQLPCSPKRKNRSVLRGWLRSI